MIESLTDAAIVLIVIVILFFGASKLPEIFRALGRATGEFKKGQMEAEMELAKMRNELSQQLRDANGSIIRSSRERELEMKIKELEMQLEELKKQLGNAK
ncbi:MAG: twin-arginine translocase TatA/TatE family subunit [Sulfolobaceae archaeon]|nr:twin-arginine translocase TatA/TatE family subunit [Sulfolobaceae archaeon]